MVKRDSELGELIDLVGKDTVDKCFTEYMMLLIAKANRLEKVEYLMDKISNLYDETDYTEENDLKYMFRVLTKILVEYGEL